MWCDAPLPPRVPLPIGVGVPPGLQGCLEGCPGSAAAAAARWICRSCTPPCARASASAPRQASSAGGREGVCEDATSWSMADPRDALLPALCSKGHPLEPQHRKNPVKRFCDEEAPGCQGKYKEQFLTAENSFSCRVSKGHRKGEYDICFNCLQKKKAPPPPPPPPSPLLLRPSVIPSPPLPSTHNPTPPHITFPSPHILITFT